MHIHTRSRTPASSSPWTMTWWARANMNLWTREARLFGLRHGDKLLNIKRADEPLSGGGRSSGLMSFLKIGDRAAGAIRQAAPPSAAKMVCLDADHPDIEAFVNWKVREEIKVATLVEGLKCLGDEHKELAEKLGLPDYDFVVRRTTP